MPANFGQHDVGYKGVSTGHCVLSLCSLANGRLRFS